jgi:hypothetical protein
MSNTISLSDLRRAWEDDQLYKLGLSVREINIYIDKIKNIPVDVYESSWKPLVADLTTLKNNQIKFLNSCLQDRDFLVKAGKKTKQYA